MNLMENFADEQMIHSLSAVEKLMGSGITAVMGMGVTFMVLLFLWGSIVVLAKLIKQPAENSQMVMIPEESPPTSNGPVHVAVIAAAVAEYETEDNYLIIKKIKRLPDRPAWSNNIIERKFSR